MKLKILFLALFVAGMAASIALASPSGDGSTTTATTTTAATTGTTTGERHKGDKGKNGCHSVELKGTLAASTLTVVVDKANKRGRDLSGTTVTVAVPAARAKVHAKLCGPAGAQTLQLTDLKLSDKPTEE